jgi:hypothetical protein
MLFLSCELFKLEAQNAVHTSSLTQYSNSQWGSTRIQKANQQQIQQPKLGGKKCVSDTTINH